MDSTSEVESISLSMADNQYHFITHWRVKGAVEDVVDIIGNAADLPRWWPAVYLGTSVLEPGDPANYHIGRVVSLYTKGWLPYTLRWTFRVAEVTPNRRLVIEPWGDFTGQGVWTFEPDGEYTNVTYDWNVNANKPLLRDLSFLFRPIFSANHHWAMKTGEESLQLELDRRSARTPAERALVPPPPRPTPASPAPLLLATAGVVAVLGFGLAAVLRANRCSSKDKCCGDGCGCEDQTGCC